MEQKRTFKCIHCLAETERTKDHVFPKLWYPDTTPGDVQRPTAPACSECNNKLGDVEERLLENLALCISPTTPEASGLRARVMRKFGVGVDIAEIGEEEWVKRDKRRIAKLKSLKPWKPGTGYFPGFGPEPGQPSETLYYVQGLWEDLEVVSEKIIRGLEHWDDRRYVEPPYRVLILFAREGSDISSVEKIFIGRERVTYGPGFTIERARAQEESRTSIYRVTAWGTLVMYGAIMTEEQLLMANMAQK